MKIKTWSDHQAAFAELIPQMSTATLTLEFGEGAEDWSINGIDDQLKKEFFTLSAAAGQALLDVHLRNHETGSSVSPEIRWFRLLRERNNPGQVNPVLIDKQGVALFEWSLDNIAEHSAWITSDLHKTHQIQDGKFWLISLFNKDPIGTTVKGVGLLALGTILLILGLR